MDLISELLLGYIRNLNAFLIHLSNIYIVLMLYMFIYPLKKYVLATCFSGIDSTYTRGFDSSTGQVR